MSREYAISNEEIEEVKKEFPLLNDAGAKIILKSRKNLDEYLLKTVHKSHKMSEWESKIMAPVGTPRFYYYRQCTICSGEQYYHSAGKFIDPELKEECSK